VAILCSHAEHEGVAQLCGSESTSLDAFEYVLDQCAGLPFALAGRATAKSACRISMQTPAGAVRDFERNLWGRSTGPLLDIDMSTSSGVNPALITVATTSTSAAVEWSGIAAAGRMPCR
jgi:hypothetical protein